MNYNYSEVKYGELYEIIQPCNAWSDNLGGSAAIGGFEINNLVITLGHLQSDYYKVISKFGVVNVARWHIRKL
jgi:hypothetical protein